MDIFVQQLITQTNDQKEFLKVVESIPPIYWWDTMCEYRKQMKRKQKKYYFYLVTFTLRAEIEENNKLIEDYIISQFEDRPPLHIEEAYIAQELTKKGKPHWHVAVKTGTCLKKDRFNYYIKKYGFVDISKSNHKSLKESLNYISKDTMPKKLVIKYT